MFSEHRTAQSSGVASLGSVTGEPLMSVPGLSVIASPEMYCRKGAGISSMPSQR